MTGQATSYTSLKRRWARPLPSTSDMGASRTVVAGIIMTTTRYDRGRTIENRQPLHQYRRRHPASGSDLVRVGIAVRQIQVPCVVVASVGAARSASSTS